jgi:hypothetical protein
MNQSLKTGSVEGSYKMIRKDAECSTAVDAAQNLTYNTRDDNSLLYYGIGMKRSMHLPGGGPEDWTSPDYYDNKLQQGVDRGMLGSAW